MRRASGEHALLLLQHGWENLRFEREIFVLLRDKGFGFFQTICIEMEFKGEPYMSEVLKSIENLGAHIRCQSQRGSGGGHKHALPRSADALSIARFDSSNRLNKETILCIQLKNNIMIMHSE